MSRINLHGSIDVICIKCNFKYGMGFSYFDNSQQRKSSHTDKCPKCGTRFYCEYEYGPKQTKIIKLDFPKSIFHKLKWNCCETNKHNSVAVEWFGKDFETKKNVKCERCASRTELKYFVKKDSVKILNVKNNIPLNKKWNEYYEPILEREDGFILLGSDIEFVGDDEKGFIDKLVNQFGLKFEDAGCSGGIGGADRWEEYCPFLDGGFVRIQGNLENPDYSEALKIEGFWIFGNKAFRFVCYIEDMTQPDLFHDEDKIPTYMELCDELKQAGAYDFSKMKNTLIGKLYGTN